MNVPSSLSPAAPSLAPGRRSPSGRLTRRHVVGGAVAAAGIASLARGGGAVWSAAQPATPLASAIGEPFVDPPEMRSTNGRLDVALVAQLNTSLIGDRLVTTYNYNGQIPAPTLRLQPGDTLGVSLQNNLPEPTNLHTHGLHVSPSGNSDNVLLHVMPGDAFDFEFNIPPADLSGLYTPGFYWYHPHIHGYSSTQVGGGMAGALIVDGELDQVPGVAEATERILVIQATQYDDTGAIIPFPTFDIIGVFVNGQAQPTIDIAPGETQRWRILNATSFTFLDLTLDGHQLHQIGADGNPLREVVSRDRVFLAPGERADVLIQGGAPGSYAFHSVPWGEDFQIQPDLPIATLTSSGDPVTPRPLPTTLLPFDDLREARIDRRRELTFSESLEPFGVFIDGQTFDMNRVNQTVQLGATEEWRLLNSSDDWHPFHIHVNDFQVVSINGEPHDAVSLEDTAAIPANGEIVIRSRFLDFTGKFVYHCHLLDHEDLGMMGIVEVVDDGGV